MDVSIQARSLLRCLLHWNPHGELLKSIQGSRFYVEK